MLEAALCYRHKRVSELIQLNIDDVDLIQDNDMQEGEIKSRSIPLGNVAVNIKRLI